MRTIIVKVCLFSLLFFMFFALMCFFFQPIWKDWNNYNTVYGFYMEPENTIETIFLGPSTVVNGISPMEIYEMYGYCTYNLGTEQQPVLASYYWLKEAYRLHSDTLRVVFFDPSSLRQRQPLVCYQKAIDGMKYSGMKAEAVSAYQGRINDRIEYMFPLFEYHDRWDTFTESDSEKIYLKPETSTRGYNPSASRYIDSDDYQKLGLNHSYYDPKESGSELMEQGLDYFNRMVSFCMEKGITFVIAGPTRPGSWNAGFHNAINELADEYGVPYYDLNASPLFDELDLILGFDQKDSHLNYYGAKKNSKWFGKYLKEHSLNRNISADENYGFMKEQMERYNSLIERNITVFDADDIAGYLSAASQLEHSYVLISIMDEGAASLTSQQREQFARLGLKKLAEVNNRESYIGVLKDGRVETELEDDMPVEVNDPEGYLSYEIKEDDIIIKSGGFTHGEVSSVLIDGIECSKNQRGINLVIYDYEDKKITDATVFDTHTSSVRTGNVSVAMRKALQDGTHWYDMEESVRKLYLYNRRNLNQKYNDYWAIYGTKTALFTYLEPYIKNMGYTIIISSKEEAAASLSEEVRKAFAEMGLVGLSRLRNEDSYIGILDEGSVYYEQSAHEQEPIQYYEIELMVSSGWSDSGSISSVRIHGEEKSLNERGLNIVVYDKQLEEVISSVTFDTHEKPPSVSPDLGVSA